MAHKSMTIDDVKKRKIQLEKDILKMLQDFEKDTKVYVSYTNFKRKNDRDMETAVDVPTSPKRGPLVNVTVEMDLDLIY